MITFSNNLYVTDAIKPQINRIKFKCISGIGILKVQFITFSSNDKDIFDIYPASYFKQKNLRKRDFYIIGVAENSSSAYELVKDMIDEALNTTEDISGIRQYFENKL